jgi:hypothetical protein
LHKNSLFLTILTYFHLLAKYGEASRALFAKNRALFEEITKNWPVDVNIHLQKLSLEAFEW